MTTVEWMTQMRRVTLNDVSAHAGVSRATASLVVRGSSKISTQTAAKVRLAMDELGYVYDRGAANMRQAHSMTLGLVMTDLGNPFFSELTMALEQYVHDRKYTLIIGYTRDDVERQQATLSAMVERRVDGIFLMPAASSTKSALKVLEANKVPTVLFARHLDGEQHYVGVDNVAAGRLMAGHLRAIGVKNAVLLGGPEFSSARAERISGLHAGADGHFKLDLQNSAFSATSTSAGIGAVQNLLDGGQIPDCIIAYSDVIAVGVMAGLRERGFEPGRAIAVVSFDDIQMAEHQVPPLTSIATHAAKVGTACAEQLLKLIAGDDDLERHVLIEPSLRVRASTGLWNSRQEISK